MDGCVPLRFNSTVSAIVRSTEGVGGVGGWVGGYMTVVVE